MSKLYGYLTNERNGVSTRAASRVIESIVQTEDARIVVTLTADGGFSIRIKRGDRAGGYSDTTAWIDGNARADRPLRMVRGDILEHARSADTTIVTALEPHHTGYVLDVSTSEETS